MKKTFFLPPACGNKPPDFSGPWLAPLAGYSDLPFRLLCRNYGAVTCETEMISAKGLVYRSPGTGELLLSHHADQPLVVQLFGAEPDIVGEAVRMLRNVGYNYFDFNMGCPVRKVLKQKCGAALMEDFSLALAIARAMIAAGNEGAGDAGPARFGFKLRLPPGGEIASFAVALVEAGASWLTIHPRTAAQGYTGSANWDKITEARRAVSIPVIASGDLTTAAAGAECMAITGATTIMYARGALSNPFIFQQHMQINAAGRLPVQDKKTIRDMMLFHISLAREHMNDARAFAKMRSLLPRYAKGFHAIRELRTNLSQCTDWTSLYAAIEQFYK